MMFLPKNNNKIITTHTHTSQTHQLVPQTNPASMVWRNKRMPKSNVLWMPIRPKWNSNGHLIILRRVLMLRLVMLPDLVRPPLCRTHRWLNLITAHFCAWPPIKLANKSNRVFFILLQQVSVSGFLCHKMCFFLFVCLHI